MSFIIRLRAIFSRFDKSSIQDESAKTVLNDGVQLLTNSSFRDEGFIDTVCEIEILLPIKGQELSGLVLMFVVFHCLTIKSMIPGT